MNLTLEQFEIATTLLSTAINGIAAFSFEGIDEDDSSNINLVFENPISLEAFFRNLSIDYDDHEPIETNLFICQRTAQRDLISKKFQSLVLNVTYSADSINSESSDERSEENILMTTEIIETLSKINACFSEVVNEYILFISELYTTDVILEEFNIQADQKESFNQKIITEYFASLITEFSYASSLADKNKVAQKIHDLSIDMNSIKLFAQRCFPETSQAPLAPYLQFGPPALNPSLTREGSSSISPGINDFSEAMPSPPARRRDIYRFYNQADAINAAYNYFKETLLSICPKARCKLSSTVDNKINILMPTKEAAELFRTCLGATACTYDPISEINIKFVSVDLLKVESHSLIAFAEACANALIYPSNDSDDPASEEYTAPRRLI